MQEQHTERFAVIDLGTNTFHIIIVEEAADGHFNELLRQRIFVKLAEQGIETIAPSACQRALTAMHTYKSMLLEYQVGQVRAFGTAALRTASNGKQLIADIYKNTGIEVQLISGDEEARLIHLGVKRAIPLLPDRSLIMDIGGGSVEFILIEKDAVLWAKSFPIGVAILFKKFHHSDPISEKEIAAVNHYIDDHLDELKEVIREHPVNTLIGASGTFDVLEMVLAEDGDKEGFNSTIQADDFPAFFHQMIHSTKDQRLEIESIPESRVDMIVVAVILIRYIIQITGIRTIQISAFAMKEGMLQELMTQK